MAGPKNIWSQENFKITFASTASNGANAVQDRLGPFDRKARVRALQAVFTGADQATHGTATTSAIYRRLRVLNGGVTGTGTTILASVNLTSSVASLGNGRAGSVVYPANATNASSGILDVGQMLVFDQITVGGTDNDGTVLAAGYYLVTLELFG